MLDLVGRAAEGLTAAEVVEATGLHPSTVRAHLDQLTESGLLTRHRRGDGSPGRPAWRYQATGTGSPPPPAETAQPYRDLAAALIGYVARDAEDPHAAGVRAGRDWGRALAAPHTASATGRPAPLDGLVAVLDQLGFSPDVTERPAPGAATVALRTCPFLALALDNPDVVCGVHQGVIGGALGALGATGVQSDLQPFALPGACLAHVRTRPPAQP
jgi:predicted ArsR family transcriptional regulator